MYSILDNVKIVYLVTEKTRDHLTPELKLALVTPKTQAYKLSQEQFPFKDPYWYVFFAKISSSYFHPGLGNLSTKNRLKDRFFNSRFRQATRFAAEKPVFEDKLPRPVFIHEL